MRTAATVLAAAVLAAVPLSPSSESEGGRAKVAERSGASQRDVYSLKRADRRGRADSREPGSAPRCGETMAGGARRLSVDCVKTYKE